MLTILVAGLVAMPCQAEFRDPTQPAYPLPTDGTGTHETVDTESGIDLVLSAIWISSRSRRATINGIDVKEGQTIEIKQAPPLNPEPPMPRNATAAKTKAPSSAPPSSANTGLDTELLSKLTAISPMQFAPLLATAAGSLDLPQLQQPAKMNAPAGTLPAASPTQHPKTTHIPLRSTTINIVSIRKNSVTIEQNGELKTLHLVQPLYTTH
jgi:hypothetical protein